MYIYIHKYIHIYLFIHIPTYTTRNTYGLTFMFINIQK